MLQSPAVKPGTAVVLKSKQGAGKGTLVEIMRKIMGNAYVGESSNPVQDVFGPHGNAHIGKILLSFDEIGSGDTNKVLGRLKNLITSHRCMYNEKGVKQVEVNNCCRFLFTTNKSIPISIDGKEDRRYCLIESSNEYCKDTVFWKDFYKNVMGNENVLYGFYKTLMNRDTSERDWMLMPDTELRNDIIQASQHPIVFFVDRLIRQMETKTKKYTSSELFSAYKDDCSGNGINFSGNCKSFGIMFKDKLPFEQCGVVKGRSRTSMFYEIDRDIMYEWLSDNNYTAFDCLPSTQELTTGTSFF
jgi:putative DNA primase/helicase